MGGPSLASYRAAEEAKRKRRAALRTRDGVVDLAELRAALKAAEGLRSIVGWAPLLLGIRVLVASEVGFELEVTLAREDPRLRVCLPSAVTDAPVRVVVRNRERAAHVSARRLPSEP